MRLRFTVVLLLVCLLAGLCFAKDDLGVERGAMKSVLKVVAADIQKNFYDPALKGLDWKALTEEAKQRIDKAGSYNEMVAAIYDFVQKVGDGHTTFMPPMNSVRVEYGFEAKPYGDQLRVYEIEKGGAAEAAGLKLGDVIYRMGNYDKITRANWEEAVVYSRALMPTSPLSMVVVRDSKYVVIEVNPKVTRSAILFDKYANYSMYWGLVMEGQNWERKHFTFRTGFVDQKKTDGGSGGGEGPKVKVGYIDVRGFPEDAANFLSGLIDDVAGAKAVVLDLRGCPGGEVQSMLYFAGFFTDKETQLGTFTGRKKTQNLMIRPHKPQVTVPVVVLVDSTTASGGEIIARYLQKTKGVTVIGDKTMGATNGAQVIGEDIGGGYINGFGIVVATDRLRFTDGEELEGKGVTPDVQCIPKQEDMAKGYDSCLDTAVQLAKKAATDGGQKAGAK